jgi:hypothetical protein
MMGHAAQEPKHICYSGTPQTVHVLTAPTDAQFFYCVFVPTVSVCKSLATSGISDMKQQKFI